MERCSAYPVLPAAAEDHHDNVTFLEPQALQVIGYLIGTPADLGKREDVLLVLFIHPDKGFFVRFLFCPRVYDVIAEVKIFRYIYFQFLFELLIA